MSLFHQDRTMFLVPYDKVCHCCFWLGHKIFRFTLGKVDFCCSKHMHTKQNLARQCQSCVMCHKIYFYAFDELKGTQAYKNKWDLFNSQWWVKTNGATSIFIEKLGNKFLPGQFWPCLPFSALGHDLKSWFQILRTKVQASLLFWYEIVWWWGREIRFEGVLSAVIKVEDHAFQFKNN